MLDHLKSSHTNGRLGLLASKMLKEIVEDREVLQSLSDKLGGGNSVLKEAGAWLAEKTARLKLRLGNDAALGEFETLEALALGILGKLKLWQVLSEITSIDSRVDSLDFNRLIERAQAQHDEVEACRLAFAKKTFVGPI
jgi:hypothetical protein